MVTDFSSLVLGPDIMAKMYGIVPAAVVPIDATLVRMVLVPPTMELLGDRNWWLPSRLDRLLPRIVVDAPVPYGSEGTHSDAASDRQPVPVSTTVHAR
jgi:RND superfamily putative drug exporter